MKRDLLDKPDMIDTREIIDRIAELEDTEDEDEKEELAKLEAVIEEIGSEAEYGVTLIREDQFEDYAMQFAEDITR